MHLTSGPTAPPLAPGATTTGGGPPASRGADKAVGLRASKAQGNRQWCRGRQRGQLPASTSPRGCATAHAVAHLPPVAAWPAAARILQAISDGGTPAGAAAAGVRGPDDASRLLPHNKAGAPTPTTIDGPLVVQRQRVAVWV